MSAFLITPKQVFQSTLCCNPTTGITDVVPDMDIGHITYIAQELAFMKWRLAATTGDWGAAGFGICCGTKTCVAEFTITYDLTGKTSASVVIEIGALSSVGEVYLVLTDIGNGFFNIQIQENGVVVSDNDIQNPGIFTHTVIVNGSITATACGGGTSAYAINYDGNDAPASIDVEFTVS